MTKLGAQPGDRRPDHDSGVMTGALPHPSDEAIPAALGVHFRLIALAALTVTLIALCVVLAVPLLPAISWAGALAILAWPMHRRIAGHVARPELAAALSSAVVVTAILATVLFVTYHLAREAAFAVERVGGKTAGVDLRERAAALPIVGRVVTRMQRSGFDIEAEIRRWIASSTRDVTALAQASLSTVIQFLVAVFILYHLLRGQESFVHGLRELLPLSRAESDLVLSRAGDSIHANLHATVVTSVIDTTGFGLLFWALDLPAPILWSVVMFLLSLLPVFGAGVVWVPAAVYLALTGQWLSAAALLGWGVLTFIFVDNALYVRLAGKRMQMHDVPALVAFLGGLALFGMSGMILGPVILAITVALLEVWKHRMATIGSPTSGA